MNVRTLIFAATACAALSSSAVEVSVDFATETGPVKPVNGVGQPPMLGGPANFRMMHYLKEAGIPYARLHDVGGWMGQGLWVDIPNLFPDFDADEGDPANYRFDYTDALMKSLEANGVEPFFRLGVTIENAAGEGFRPRRIEPPKDFAKWARICEHVIRHYTEGWADGFRMKVSYWEIWNEPENYREIEKNCMWKSDFGEYIRFYGTVAPYLKAKFPHLKIGGYASCGFYVASNAAWVKAANSSPRVGYFLEAAKEFLAAAKAGGWPLDFFSYHTYSNPTEAAKEVRYVDELLTSYGFTRDRTERICNEWLCYVSHDALGTARQAAGIAAEIVGFQNGPCDLACVYDARCGIGNYSPLFNPFTYKPHKAYYAFTAFNELRKRGTAVKASSSDGRVLVAAAKDASGAAVMIVNDSDDEKPLTVDFQGRGTVSARITDAERTDEPVPLPERLPPHSILSVILARGFDSARAVWPKGEEMKMNTFFRFRTEFSGSAEKAAVLKVTAGYDYKAWLNGRFVGFGPARCAPGFFRVDEWRLPAGSGRNVLEIDVAGYNCNNFYLPDQVPFLQAEVAVDGKTVARTAADGEFAAYSTGRVRKVPRFSYQRTFAEVYRLPHAAGDALPLAERNETRELLPREWAYPDFAVTAPFAARSAETVTWDADMKPKPDRYIVTSKANYKHFRVDELDENPYYDIQRLKTVSRTAAPEPDGAWYRLDANGGIVFSGAAERAGFPMLKVRCKAPVTLYFTFDELLQDDGSVNQFRAQALGTLVWHLDPGEHDLEGFEPIAFRCARVLAVGGAAEITAPRIRTYESPTAERASFRSSDPALEKIFNAARGSYRANAVDCLTDCPIRERAGWLGDTFFTGRASKWLTGSVRNERLFLENFLRPDRFDCKEKFRGLVPAVWPVDLMSDACFIPNYDFWFVLELEEFAARGGDPAFVRAFGPRVMEILNWFEGRLNSDGLLEKLPGWVFVEWSKANDLVQDVNYPSNMMYAKMLDAAARMYALPDLSRQAAKVRETIRRQALTADGWYCDNAVRQADGSLKLSGERTEVCQYYAFFTGTATKERDAELWKRLVEDFGPNRTKWKEIWPANFIFGTCLRLELLSQDGRRAQIYREIRDYFLQMAEKTGTLWEHNDPRASCCHGFSSIASEYLIRDILGFRGLDPKTGKPIVERPEGLDLDWCRATLPVSETETVEVGWGTEEAPCAQAEVARPVVISEEAIVRLRPGQDSFEGHDGAGWTLKSDVGLRLTIPKGSGTVRMKPYREHPPFRGPKEVVVETDGRLEGTATLTIKNHHTGAFKSATLPLAKTMRFPLGGRVGETYVFESFAVTSSVSAGVTCDIARFTGVYEQTAAEACRFDIDTGNPLHLVTSDVQQVALVFANPSGERLHWRGKVRFRDFYGRASEKAFDFSVAGGETARLPVSLVTDVTAKGAWIATAEIAGDDGSQTTSETRFAVIDVHPITSRRIPGKGEFRPGVQLHCARASEPDRVLEFDAAAAMGAKLVRIDFTFSPPAICRKGPGQFDWAVPDRMLADAEARGMGVDALIFENLGWRYDEPFCEALAARYGTRLDFYEIGNEWDMYDVKTFPVARAVEIQKASYRALKKGCPAVRVITNGWTVEDSNGHEAVVQKGFQETFLADAKGFFDMHAIHLHGTFDYYRRKLARWFELRREKGVADVPWYPNETALSNQYRGEEPVAEAVWQKMLHSWSLGATDHIWYTQRTARPRGDLTFGYGMMSYGWRPALSYCAFSSFVTVFGGLSYDRKLTDGEYRHVHRMRGVRDGRSRLVVAGWDAAAMEKPVPIRVRTDAPDVWAVDLMGNRRRLHPEGGSVTWDLSSSPSAVVCEGGTELEPDAAELAHVLEMPVKVVRVLPNRDGRGWDFRMEDYKLVNELYPADPANAHRTWKGKDDLSAILLFHREADGYGRAHLFLTDDKYVEGGDRVRFFVDGRDVTSELKVSVGHYDNHIVYDAVLPKRKQFRFNVRLIDDDGYGGPDGWMDLVPFDEKNPVVKAWPYVTFE